MGNRPTIFPKQSNKKTGMVDRCEFFRKPSWHFVVERNFASSSRNFVNLEVRSSVHGESVKIPLVLEELEVPDLGNVCFGRYASVYLSDYFDFSNSESLSRDSIEELRNKADDNGVDVLWLSNLPLNENFYAVLHEFSKDREDCYFLDCIPTLGVKCHSSYGEYLLSLSKNSRRNIRRKNEALRKVGVKHRIVPLTGEKIGVFLRNQAARAQSVNLDVIANNLALLRTITDIIDMEGVQVSELYIGEKVISQLLLLIGNQTIGVLAQSFDSAYSEYSPSFCNFANLIEYAHVHGYKYVDLLRGNEDYKRHFINNVIEMRKFVLILNPSVDPTTLIPFLERFEE